MSEQPQPENKPVNEDKVTHIVMGMVMGIILAVLALEYYGYIRHSVKSDAATVAEFKLLTLKPGYDLKVSHKPSGKMAFCAQGYVLMKPENDQQVAGVLVDAKGRGIRCEGL